MKQRNTEEAVQPELMPDAEAAPTATAIAERPQSQPAAVQTGDASEPDELALLERFAKDPTIDLERFERLMGMIERARKQRQEMAFNGALSRAAKNIKAAVTDSYNDQTKSWFATYEALDAVARPHYSAEGLVLTFKPERSDIPDYITVVCLVKHDAGHTERYALDLPADGKGAKGGDVMTKTHATGSAITYAMRYLLKMVFNIPTKDKGDDDGNRAGGDGDRKIPPAPPKFDEWWLDIQSAADEGLDALDKAWKDTKRGELKQFIHDHYPKEWAALKSRAAAVRR